ncbi:MAG: hypothetical protein GQ558_00790 [Thermoplasmata archaeon]|nr:hypothetical protein [Thermoplasmata archaeon]
MSREGRIGGATLRTATIILTVAVLMLLLAPSCAAEGSSVDGDIHDDEYEFRVSLGDGHFTLYWKFLDNDTIQMAIQAKASGMVAVGFDPTVRMKDADMVIAFRQATGEFDLHDAWSLGETGPHPDDVDEGGSFDLLKYTVKESGGVTTAEFTRLLSTGDDLDNDIPREGKMTLIWATSDTDEFATYHTRRGTAIINMGTGEFESTEYPVLWPYHAISMSLAMIFLAAAFFCVVYKRRLKKKYLNYHHWLGTIGVAFATIGLIIGVYMVAQLESGHIRVAHSTIASIDLALAFTALAMGIVFQRRRDMKRKIRKPHMYVGALAMLMMAATVIAGVMYVFPA